MPTLGLTLAILAALPQTPAVVRIDAEPNWVRLANPDRRVQILVTGLDEEGRQVDLTHAAGVRFDSTRPGVVNADRSGRLVPTGDGEAVVTVSLADLSTRVRVKVVGVDHPPAVDFETEVVPVLTRFGCNGGGCHGKSGGQNGFRLSLFGSDVASDFATLTRDARGRRVSRSDPSESLLLRKPTNRITHGGGLRLQAGSPEYRTLERWIAQGSPRRAPHSEPISVTVAPRGRILAPGSTQQLRVVATGPDGTQTDVTRLARFQSCSPDLAAVSPDGVVEALGGVGEATVSASFGGAVAVSRLTVPNARYADEWEGPAPRNFIDVHIFKRLKKLRVPPSGACTDAEFARRSSLDVCGRLPNPADVRRLEQDRDAEKRVRWVSSLVDDPGYADRFANEWSGLLRNRREFGPPSKPGTHALHAWVRQCLAENRPFDRVVTDLLTAKGDPSRTPAVVWYRQPTGPEERAEDVAQLFMGVRLQCAKCHRHPSDRWTPADYYGFAGFFTRVGRKSGSDPISPRVYLIPEGKARNPVDGSEYDPRWLGGPPPAAFGPRDDPREALAAWLTKPSNPYFARALVNRYWKFFFGRGLVEPVDDFRVTNPPSNPELLQALSEDFAAHGFDLKRLVHLMVTSRAYDRSSVPRIENELDRQHFARFRPRRLNAESLHDAIADVTGAPSDFDALPPGTRAVSLPDEGYDTANGFLGAFGRPRRATVCDCERSTEPSLSQSLLLLNAADVETAVKHPDGRAAAWAVDPRPDAEKVEELYRRALSRSPTPDEQDVCLAHLKRRRADGRVREGFEDVAWAILNTKEFQVVQ